VPVVAVTALMGVVETRYGSGAMLLTEAGLGAVSALGYALVAYLWRPEAEGVTAALAAA
jgi:hypothetical protein